MFFVDWALLIYAIYVPFFLILYILEIIVIVKYRTTIMDSSYYRTFTVLASVNILACLLGCFVFRFPLYPVINSFYSRLTKDSKWLTASYIGAYYLNSLSEFLGVFLACNRFTALCFPLAHDKLWRWLRIIAIPFCFICAILPVWYLFDDESWFVEMRDIKLGYKWYFLDILPSLPQVSVWFNMVIVTVVSNLLCLLFYGACLIRLFFFTMNRNHVVERNLFLVGFLTIIFSLPYTAAMLFFSFQLSIEHKTIDVDQTAFVGYQLPWLTDLKYLSPAPMLFLMSHSIQKGVKNLFPCYKTRVMSTQIQEVSQCSNVNEMNASA